jgi:hypothetical protein
MIASLPISLPSLTHLDTGMHHDICLPPTISRLRLLKSLTDLQLTIDDSQPKADLIALQPLASVLTRLILNIGSTLNDNEQIDNARGENSYQMLSHLLPFRSLTTLAIHMKSSGSSTCYYMEITSSFIRQHWNKSEKEAIYVHCSSLHLFHVLSGFLSLSSAPTTLPLTSTMNDLLFGIKSSSAQSLNELNKLLEDFETVSILIPPSSTLVISPPPIHSSIPIISLECTLGYGKGEAEALRIQSLEREMYNRVKSIGYSNLSSFTIRTIQYT